MNIRIKYGNFLIILVAFSFWQLSGFIPIQNLNCGARVNCGCAHSFLRPRPISQDLSLEMALQQYNLYYNELMGQSCLNCRDQHQWVDVQLTGFYYQSTDRQDLARYFLPNCKSDISIGQNNSSDISSLWLGLVAPLSDPYSSVFSIRPKREAMGGTIKIFFDFKNITDNCWLTNSWIYVYIPVVYVRHFLNPAEDVIGGAGSLPDLTNALEAFNNTNWCFGKISPCILTKTGVDDVQIKFGCNVQHTCENYCGIYGVVFAPTGTISKADYLFEPVIGGGHTGVGAGINKGCTVYSKGESRVAVLAELRYAYFFSGNETRSIDLVNGNWSRYLLVASSETPGVSEPGINVTTQTVRITPGSTVDIWLALHASKCNYDFEVGYDFWWRQAEKVCFNNCGCPPTAGILDIAGCPCPVSASTAQICAAVRNLPGAPISDVTFTPISLGQFNLKSAGNPIAVSNKCYIALGAHQECRCHPTLFGIGASYEFGNSNAALSQWGIWGKASIAW